MPIVKREDVQSAFPETFRDTLVVRCTDHTFGTSSNGNPMVTTQWEICGVPNPDGSCSGDIEHGGKTYSVAGKRAQTIWYTLKGGGLDMWFKLLEAAGESTDEVDTDNPDHSFLDKLCMTAVVTVRKQTMYKQITPEEKKAGKKAEPIMGPGNKPLKEERIVIEMFVEPWEGALPENMPPY